MLAAAEQHELGMQPVDVTPVSTRRQTRTTTPLSRNASPSSSTRQRQRRQPQHKRRNVGGGRRGLLVLDADNANSLEEEDERIEIQVSGGGEDDDDEEEEDEEDYDMEDDETYVDPSEDAEEYTTPRRFRTPVSFRSGGSASTRRTGRKRSTTPKETPGSSGKRLDNSLAQLTGKFVGLFKDAEGGSLDLNAAASALGVRKRRIYDITNVLEGVGLIGKASTNHIEWRGGSQASDPQQAEVENKHALSLQRRELAVLEEAEWELDQQIQQVNMEMRNCAEANKSLCFVSEKEVLSLPELKDQSCILIRGPPGTTVEVPEESMPAAGKEMYLSSAQGPIMVRLLGEQDSSSAKQSNPFFRCVDVQPSFMSNLKWLHAPTPPNSVEEEEPEQTPSFNLGLRHADMSPSSSPVHTTDSELQSSPSTIGSREKVERRKVLPQRKAARKQRGMYLDVDTSDNEMGLQEARERGLMDEDMRQSQRKTHSVDSSKRQSKTSSLLPSEQTPALVPDDSPSLPSRHVDNCHSLPSGGRGAARVLLSSPSSMSSPSMGANSSLLSSPTLHHHQSDGSPGHQELSQEGSGKPLLAATTLYESKLLLDDQNSFGGQVSASLTMQVDEDEDEEQRGQVLRLSGEAMRMEEEQLHRMTSSSSMSYLQEYDLLESSKMQTRENNVSIWTVLGTQNPFNSPGRIGGGFDGLSPFSADTRSPRIRGRFGLHGSPQLHPAQRSIHLDGMDSAPEFMMPSLDPPNSLAEFFP